MSKNDPNKRGEKLIAKFNGKVVKPVLYIGTHVGHGSYMAIQYENGQMEVDSSGKPLSWEAVATAA